MVASLFGQLSATASYSSSDQLDSAKEQASPRTTRRRLMFTNKIFQGEAFYLDLRTSSGSRVRAQLEADLPLLGGRVEAFLSKEITHVITDKVDLLASAGTSSSSSTALSSKSSASRSGKASTAVFSRAQALLNRAKHKQEQNLITSASDPISLAKQWGIRIITLQKVLHIIEREKSKCDPSRKFASGKQGSKGVVRCRNLEGAFIKVEDMSGQYRPTSKNFASFPVIDIFNPDIDHHQSPFVARRKKTCPPDINIPKEKSLISTNGLRKETKVSVAKPDIPNAAWTPKAAATPNEGAKSKVQAGYCESCDKQYQNLQEHIKSDIHKRFSLNNKNFIDLDSVVASLPTLQQLMETLQVSSDQDYVKDELKATSVSECSGGTKMCLSEGALSEAEKGLVTPIKMEFCDEADAPVGSVSDGAKVSAACLLAGPAMAISLPELSKAPKVASNVSSNDATVAYDGPGPGPGTSQSGKELTLPYGRLGPESSQNEKDSTLPYEESFLETSQSEKDRTMSYEDQCPVSSQEDVVYNQQDGSVTVNDKLPVDITITSKAGNLNDTQILDSIGKPETDVILFQNETASPNKINTSLTIDVKPDVDSLVTSITMGISEDKALTSHCTSNDFDVDIKLTQPQNPILRNGNDKTDPSERSVKAAFRNLGTAHPTSLHIQKSQVTIEEVVMSGDSRLSEISNVSNADNTNTGQEQRGLFEHLQMDVKKNETITDMSDAVSFVDCIENIAYNDLVAPPVPSESNDGTLQEPLSSRGDHFDISPIKLLTQFPFHCSEAMSEKSRCSAFSECVPPSSRSDDEQTRSSFSAIQLISENSTNQYLKGARGSALSSVRSTPNIQHTSSSKHSFATVPSARVDAGPNKECLPQSNASDITMYPTSFSNILSNLSASRLSFSGKAHDNNIHPNQDQASNFDISANTSSHYVTSFERQLNRPSPNENTPMECSSQPSSDAVENSIAMNLMAKLQNQDLDSSGSDSESNGFIKGNHGPASFDLDSMDLVSNKMTDIEEMLNRDSVVCDSRSMPNIVLPLDVNSHSMTESRSSILPQTYVGSTTQPTVEKYLDATSATRLVGNSELASSPNSTLQGARNSSEHDLRQSLECDAFDLNKNRYSQLSFADLAKSAQILPHFQQDIRQSECFVTETKQDKTFLGIDSNETNRLFSNCTTITENTCSRPWSPSMILISSTKPDLELGLVDEGAKAKLCRKSSSGLQRGPYISPAKSKVVGTKLKKDKSKHKKKSGKKHKENRPEDHSLATASSSFVLTELHGVRRDKKEPKASKSKVSSDWERDDCQPEGNSLGCLHSRLGTETETGKMRKRKKKVKETKLEKPKKTKNRDRKSKKDIDESQLQNTFETPKAALHMNLYVDSPNNVNSVWVATPSRGLKMRLCRVVVTPLGPKAAGDKHSPQKEGINGMSNSKEENINLFKSRKKDKKKHEKTNRRKLDL